MSPQEALAKIRIEYERAAARQGAFNWGQEGYAVIREELDELWEEVKSKDGLGRAWEEAVQVAAMALRFLVDLPRETKRGPGDEAARSRDPEECRQVVEK